MKLLKKDFEVLATIATLGQNGGFESIGKIAKLHGEGLVEINENLKDDEGKVAVRISAKGTEFLAKENAEAEKEAAPVATKAPAAEPQPIQTFDKGVPIPTRSGRRAVDRFNMEAMQEGDSFFTTDTSVGSAVTRFNKRFKDERKLITRKVSENGLDGIRVWRVQ